MASALQGVAALEAQLKRLGQATAVPIMRRVIRKAIRPAYVKAAETIPVGTEAHRTYKGRLVAPGFAKRSLRVVTRASEDGKRVSAAMGVRKEAFYVVVFDELGTSKMAARPWLRPALQTTQDAQETILAEALRAEIDKAINK